MCFISLGASSPALDARIKLIQAQADLSPNMNPQTKYVLLFLATTKLGGRAANFLYFKELAVN